MPLDELDISISFPITENYRIKFPLQIKQLSIRGDDFNWKELKKNSELRSLSLNYITAFSNEDEDDIVALVINNTKTLRELTLNSIFYRNNWRDIFNNLPNCIKLTKLNIHSWKINYDASGFDKLCELILHPYCSLEILNLTHSEASHEQIEKLVQAIEKNTTVKELELTITSKHPNNFQSRINAALERNKARVSNSTVSTVEGVHTPGLSLFNSQSSQGSQGSERQNLPLEARVVF
jgi:hypothetical protein